MEGNRTRGGPKKFGYMSSKMIEHSGTSQLKLIKIVVNGGNN